MSTETLPAATLVSCSGEIFLTIAMTRVTVEFPATDCHNIHSTDFQR